MAFDLALQTTNEYGQVSVSWDTLGNLNVIRGQDKLQQDINKILFTDQNPLDVNFATILKELVGSNLGKNTTIIKISDTVTNALNYLQNLQQVQSQIQQVDVLEIIQDIVSINVNYLPDLTQNANDVSAYSIEIVVTNGGGQSIGSTRVITAI